MWEVGKVLFVFLAKAVSVCTAIAQIDLCAD